MFFNGVVVRKGWRTAPNRVVERKKHKKIIVLQQKKLLAVPDSNSSHCDTFGGYFSFHKR